MISQRRATWSNLLGAMPEQVGSRRPGRAPMRAFSQRETPRAIAVESLDGAVGTSARVPAGAPFPSEATVAGREPVADLPAWIPQLLDAVWRELAQGCAGATAPVRAAAAS